MWSSIYGTTLLTINLNSSKQNPLDAHYNICKGISTVAHTEWHNWISTVKNITTASHVSWKAHVRTKDRNSLTPKLYVTNLATPSTSTENGLIFIRDLRLNHTKTREQTNSAHVPTEDRNYLTPKLYVTNLATPSTSTENGLVLINDMRLNHTKTREQTNNLMYTYVLFWLWRKNWQPTKSRHNFLLANNIFVHLWHDTVGHGCHLRQTKPVSLQQL
jgi:hypothetical protein